MRSNDEARYAHIVRAVFETPWAILPSTLALIVDIVHFRAAGGFLSDSEISERISAANHGPRRGGGKLGNAVGVIPIYGVIASRQNMMRSSGGTSVQSVTASLREMLADDDVGSIVFDIDSPGGTVDGVEELASEIRAARDQKPIYAVANTMAASAAYWLAAAAQEIAVTPSGAVGSIGVFAAHQDLSKAAEMEGVKTTLISAGKFKTEGNEWEPLTEEARANIQGQVDGYYDMFVSAVAKGRGIAVGDVRGGFGEGRTVLAKEAVKLGMADRVATLDQTIARAASGKITALPGQGGTGSKSAYLVRPISQEDIDDAPLLQAHGLVFMEALAAAASPDATPCPMCDHPADCNCTVCGCDDASHDNPMGALAAAEILAGPLAVHHGITDNGPFDGPGTEAAIPNDAGAAVLERMFAWLDDAGDPDKKAAYRFVHHFYRGAAGPASTRACTSGIGVLNGGRGGTTIPETDKAGVHAHLAAHLRDAGLHIPPLNGALDTGLPFAERLALVTDEVEALVTHSHARADMRAKAGRHLSADDRRALTTLAAQLSALAAEPASGIDERERSRIRARLVVLEAAARSGYILPTEPGAAP